jgi:hypothetical protein
METLTTEQLIAEQKQKKKEEKQRLSKEWKEYNTKKAKAERLEEVFRRERNTRWASHTGIEDVTKWYDEGNRMPHELELMTIQLKMEGYLLKEIFELFDKHEAKAAKRGKEAQHRLSISEWFDKTIVLGLRVYRHEAYRRSVADGVYIQKKEFFKLLEEKCGKPYKCNGNFCFRGWSLVEPT